MNQEVLSIQEILERVLLFVEKKSLASCSVVNRQWSTLAITLIWNSLDSQRPLLELLAPLQDRTEIDYPYDEHVVLGYDPARVELLSWERFNFYAPFVKRLAIPTYPYYYAESIIHPIALWRESFSLLPNLEELIVDCREGDESRSRSIDFALLFLSKSLKELRFTFHKIENISSICKPVTRVINAFLDAIPKRAPKLRLISLRVSNKETGRCVVSRSMHSFAWSKEGFIKLLPSLHGLETLILCPKFVDPTLFNGLSSLQNLKNLQFYCDQHVLYDRTHVWGNPQNTPEGLCSDRSDFPSVNDLSLTSSFATATYLLSATAPPNLTCLTIVSQTSEPAMNVSSIIWTIGQAFPLLRKLKLESRLKSLTDVEDPDPLSYLLCLESFQPLTSLTQLTSLSFTYARHLHLSKSEFEHLISHWPLLEELHLIPFEGDSMETPYLTPHALASVAQHCPHIRRLTISVSWDSIEAQMDGDLFATPNVDTEHKFSMLDSVKFGYSPIREDQTAAVAVLLVDLSITSSAVHPPDPITSGKGDELLSIWKDIKKLMMIASHYKRQNRRLQDRVEVLQSRIESLETGGTESRSSYV